jgi:ABC-type multidrug transport system ATPase subunit
MYSQVTPFLSNVYHSDQYTDFDRFTMILLNLWKFFGAVFMIFIIIGILMFPIIFYFYSQFFALVDGKMIVLFIFPVDVEHDISPQAAFANLVNFVGFFGIFAFIVKITSNPASVEEFMKELSPYAFSYNHNFSEDLHKRISEIYSCSEQVIKLFLICIIVIMQEIMFYERMNSSIFSVMQAMSGVIFIIYLIVKISRISVSIKMDSTANARSQQIYEKELNKLNPSSENETNVWSWFFLNVFVYLSLSFVHVFVKEGGVDIKKILLGFLFNSIGIIGICSMWITYNSDLDKFMDNMNYLIRTYDVFSSVIRESWELSRIKSFDNINSIELYIRKYMYINIPKEMLNTNELSQFAVRFNKLLCSGDIDGADVYLKQCPSDELREFLKKEIRNRDNLLLSNVGISFQKMCNSFAVGEIDEDTDEYISLISKTGRITVLSGESGSGKSTMNNSIMGDNQFLSAFINGYPSYLVSPVTKKFIPCYSDNFGVSVTGLSLMQNMQLFDLTVNREELMHIWSHIGIAKYIHQLSDIMGMVHFSKGQGDRMTISKILVALNSILKAAGLGANELNENVLRALKNDVNDDELTAIREELKLSSFMVVLDEPLGALDKKYAGKVMELLYRYTKLGFSFLIIDHSGVATNYANDIIEIENKTCEYYTKVDGQMVNLKNLNFGDGDTLVLGDTIAYKHACKKPVNVNKIRKLYKSDKFKKHKINVCKVSNSKRLELLNILLLHNEILDNDIKSEISTNASDLSDRINDFDDNQIVMLKEDNLDKIDRIVMLNEDNLDKIDKIVMLNESPKLNAVVNEIVSV